MTADQLRAQGWLVAVHNDYRLNGELFTFWLFTKGNLCVRGEGRTDAEALSQVEEEIERVCSSSAEQKLLNLLAVGSTPTIPSKTQIFVNGRSLEVTADFLSYEDVVRLAYPNYTRIPMLSMTFRGGGSEGLLCKGDTVKVCAGLKLNVADTSSA